MSGTTIVILVATIPAVIGLVVWFTLLVLGARADGRYQREHEPRPPGGPPGTGVSR